MKRGWLAVVVAVAACSGGTTPVGSVSPSPSAVTSTSYPSNVFSPSPEATTSPSPSARPPVNFLRCRLPVAWSNVTDSGQIQKAGFLVFPQNAVAEDASAPAGSGFYDRPFARWLPARREAVSPDGKRYAYAEGDVWNAGAAGKVHVVDVRTKVDRVVYTGSPVYGIVDFAAEGVYLTAAVPEGYPSGLWLLDPAGGKPRLISKTIEAPVVGAGAAWGLDFNAADSHPAPGGMVGPKNRILRYDLATGTASAFYYRPGTSLFVSGVDRDGSLFVFVNVDQSRLEMWRVTSASVAARLFNSPGLLMPQHVAAFDANGVWFDGFDYRVPRGQSLWLYRDGALQLVTTVDADTFSIAGGCIP